MNEQGFIRARSPENKAKRAKDILKSAMLVLDRDGIDAVTLTAIAREAGVVKSNIYRYFESREEILFRLMLEESDYLTELGAKRIDALERPVDIAKLAETLAADFAQNPRFCLLISQMGPILEHNISFETLVEMKREVVVFILRVAEAIQRAVPEIGSEGAARTLHTCVHLIAGLWPMANPPEPVVKALETPDLAFMRQDFELSLRQSIHALFEGTKAINARAKGE